jgi:hypothetical protein
MNISLLVVISVSDPYLLNPEPDLGFLLDPDPNPGPDFNKKREKISVGKKFKFYDKKLAIYRYLFLGPYQGLPSYRRYLQPS